MKKNNLIWILAIIITISAAIYQRKTGPTYPKKVVMDVAGNTYTFKFLRSSNNDKDAAIELNIPDTSIQGTITYRLYPINSDWETDQLYRDQDKMIGYLPFQPAAGKIEYYITLFNKNQPENITQSEHIIIRFKGAVPAFVLIPHIFFIFLAMLFSNLAGLMAITKIEKQRFYGIMTLVFLIIGGMILGPIMQQYAFGQAWTGVPFGWDLTDNKTLIAVIFWIIAVVANFKKPNLKLTIIAAVILLLIYTIPHSMFGSEFDYSKGKVVTGFITSLF